MISVKLAAIVERNRSHVMLGFFHCRVTVTATLLVCTSSYDLRSRILNWKNWNPFSLLEWLLDVQLLLYSGKHIPMIVKVMIP